MSDITEELPGTVQKNVEMSEAPNLPPSVVMPGGRPHGFRSLRMSPLRHEQTTFAETAGANFRLYNLPYRAFQSISNPWTARTTREDGYNPIEEGLLEDIPSEYYYSILSQTTRKDGELVRQRIFKELEDKSIAERSGFFTNAVTTLGATLLSPDSLIPISQTVKYAKASQGLIKNSIKTATTLGPVAAIQNAALVASKETDDITDWAYDTMFDTFIGSAFGGALGAYKGAKAGRELSNANAIFKSIRDDVDIKYELKANGEVVKPIAVAAEGSSVGAKAVNEIQELLDSGQVDFRNNGTVKKVFGFGGLGSPVITGLTSEFETVSEITAALFPHPFESARGEAKAIPKPSAYDFVRDARNRHAQLGVAMREAWLRHVGADGVARGARASVGSLMGKNISLEEFKEMVAIAYRSGQSKIPEVMEVANMYKKELYEPLFEDLKKVYPDLELSSPINSAQNAVRGTKLSIKAIDNRIVKPRAARQDKIRSRLDEIDKDLAKKQKELDKLFKVEGPASGKHKDVSLDQLLKERRRIRDLLDEGNLSDKETKRLESQMRELGAEMKSRHREKIMGELLEEQKKLQEQLAAGGLSKEEIKALREDRKALEEQLLEQEAHHKKLIDELNANIKAKKIDLDLLDPKVSPKELPKLRRVLSDSEMDEVVEGVFNNVMQLNEEQMVGEIFNNVTSGGNNPLKSRTLLWNDALAEKWLVNDMDALSGIYADQVSKRVHFADIAQKYGADIAEGEKGIVAALSEEYKTRLEDLNAQPESKERDKAIKSLNKQFEKSKNFLSDIYKLYMGTYVDKSTTGYRVANSIKEFSAATLLGNLPILQLTEFFSPLFRFTFDEYISDGLSAALSRMNYVASQKMSDAERGYIRGAFADLNQGLNVALGSRMQALMGYGTEYAPRTALERGISNFANMSQNISLANHIMDFQELTVSFASQSSLIRSLEKFKSGEKLTRAEIDKLDRAKLNPHDWADRITSQFGINKTEEGAWVANFHLWEDQEAARRFRIAIEKEVRQVLVKPDPLDVPLWMRSPAMSVMTQFTSYMFAATNNFSIPALTNPDAQKFVGMIAMMAAGAMVDPLRQLARGDEVDMDKTALAMSAFDNSGIFTWHVDQLLRANALLDLPPLRPFQGDRKKTIAGLSPGPAFGIGGNAMKFLGALASGEMNMADARRGMRLLVPFSGTWYARRPIDDLLDSLNLPKTRRDAEKLKEF
jgi:hypothetical protein